jgi:hypothetical protein
VLNVAIASLESPGLVAAGKAAEVGHLITATGCILLDFQNIIVTTIKLRKRKCHWPVSRCICANANRTRGILRQR